MDKIFEKFNNKKMIENLVIFLILAVIVMIVINSVYKESDSSTQNVSTSNVINTTLNTEAEKSIEERLSLILSQIRGAGKVDVMISYQTEVQKVPMTDVKTTTTVTNEKDSNGGERKTEEINKEESVIYEETGSSKVPVVKQNLLPEIVGVIVVADGAGSLSVKENLIHAVEAIVDVPTHHIQVFAR